MLLHAGALAVPAKRRSAPECSMHLNAYVHLHLLRSCRSGQSDSILLNVYVLLLRLFFRTAGQAYSSLHHERVHLLLLPFRTDSQMYSRGQNAHALCILPSGILSHRPHSGTALYEHALPVLPLHRPGVFQSTHLYADAQWIH